MDKSKSKNKRRRARRRVNATANKQQQKQSWPSRLRTRIAVANKAILAAAGAGILAAITAGVVAVPHVVAAKLGPSSPPLTVGGAPAGDADGGVAPAADPCELQGDFVVPGMLHLPATASTNQLASLTGNAADAGTTSGTYTLQAAQGQTVVITAIHTVVVRRVPAPQATEVAIDSMCAGAAPIIYSLTINLDGTDLSPEIQGPDPGNPDKTITMRRLQTTVTNDSPIVIDFSASTRKYDVTWEILIDYTIDGKSKTAWIENGSAPFHTEAVRPDDTDLTASLNSDQTNWNISRRTPGQ
jgi:hypothetical protein